MSVLRVPSSAETPRLDLPMAPKRVSKDCFALIGAALGQWLAVAGCKGALPLLAKLVWPSKVLATIATIVDQSNGKAVLRIRRPRRTRHACQGCSLYLHPEGVQAGDDAGCADRLPDLAGGREAHLDLGVPSFAESLWFWLTASGAEYGCTVE